MLQFLKLITIFASSVEKDWRLRDMQIARKEKYNQSIK